MIALFKDNICLYTNLILHKALAEPDISFQELKILKIKNIDTMCANEHLFLYLAAFTVAGATSFHINKVLCLCF